MVRVFSSGPRSGIKLTNAVIPWGTVLEGMTIMFLSSVKSLACCAAMIMFLLLGRMKMFSAFTRSMAFSISSVLGFMVCPPSIRQSAPIPLKISLRPSPLDTAIKPYSLRSDGASSPVALSLSSCSLAACSLARRSES